MGLSFKASQSKLAPSGRASSGNSVEVLRLLVASAADFKITGNLLGARSFIDGLSMALRSGTCVEMKGNQKER